MAEGEEGKADAEELAEGDQAEGADASLEGTPAYSNIEIIAITLKTERILREFLISLGWGSKTVSEFNKVVTLIGTSFQEGDYKRALEAFGILKNDLRRIFANKQYEGGIIESGAAVGVDKIQALLSMDLEPFCNWILHQHQEVSAEQRSVEPPATATIARITKESMGAAAAAANVAFSAGRRRSPATTPARSVGGQS